MKIQYQLFFALLFMSLLSSVFGFINIYSKTKTITTSKQLNNTIIDKVYASTELAIYLQRSKSNLRDLLLEESLKMHDPSLFKGENEIEYLKSVVETSQNKMMGAIQRLKSASVTHGSFAIPTNEIDNELSIYINNVEKFIKLHITADYSTLIMFFQKNIEPQSRILQDLINDAYVTKLAEIFRMASLTADLSQKSIKTDYFYILMIIFLGFLLSYIFSKKLSKPVQAITDAISELKTGNLGFKISINTNNEFGQIINSFNNMSENLKISNERMKNFFELGLIGMAITSPEDKGWLEVNDKLCTIFGYSRKVLTQMSWSELTHPDDLEKDVAQFELVLANKSDGYSMKKRFIRKNKDILYARIDVKCIRYTDGRVNYFVALVQDITEQTLAELKLKNSEQHYKTLVETIPYGIEETDVDGNITYFNDAYCNIWGCPHGDIRNRKIFDFLLNEEDKVQLKQQLQYYIDEEVERKSYQIHTKNKDGKDISIQVDWNYKRDDQNKIMGFISVVTDITESLLAEKTIKNHQKMLEVEVEVRTKELRYSHQQLDIFKKFADQSGQGFGLAKLDQTIYYMNPELCQMLGFSDMDEAIGRSIMDCFLPTEQIRLANEILPRVMQQKQWIGENKIISQRGEEYTILQNVFLISDSQSETNYLATAISDITEQKLIQQKLKLANQSKSDFLARMSHELRTPMNAILGFGQILNLLETDESKKYQISHILTAGEHLLVLINEVLDIVEADSRKMKFNIRNFNLNELINECIEMLQPLTEKNNISIQDKFDLETCYWVNADRIRIKQVVINLLSNAIKYNKTNGTIAITIKQNEQFIQVNVIDTGTGIPENLKHNIFEPFKRLHLNNNVEEGTGIGLTISKKLIELMNGHIGFNSLDNQGSTFWFDIPSGQIETHESASALQCSSKRSGMTKKVLYIEDTPASIELMEEVFKQYNVRHDHLYELISTHNAEIGVDIAITLHPDLIIMDINLPGMNGFQALKKLKQNNQTHQIPVIALSANALSEEISNGLNAGFTDYLTKPVCIEALMNTLDKTIG